MKKIIMANKKSNLKGNHYNRNNVNLPEVINMDSLSCFDDESLDRLHTHLQTEREKVGLTEFDTQPWEVEICYVQREIKIRSSRRAAHEKYMKSNPEAYHDAASFE